MEEPYLTYSLSFRHARTSRKPPELVLTLSSDVLAHAEQLLSTTRLMHVVDIREYLREDISDPWTEPELEFVLPKKKPFGIGQCAYVTTADGTAEIHFPYTMESCYRVTMTLHVLFMALEWSMEREGRSSNQHQLCSISTRCEHGSMGWGHMIGGDVYPTFRRWLAILQAEQREVFEQRIGEAVLEAFLAFSEPNKRKQHRKFWEEDCRAMLSPEGRFYIRCPGNACDIAIYPDSDSVGDDYAYCRFGCHNLDSAVQQLSLLAGFATLCEFARHDMNT